MRPAPAGPPTVLVEVLLIIRCQDGLQPIPLLAQKRQLALCPAEPRRRLLGRGTCRCCIRLCLPLRLGCRLNLGAQLGCLFSFVPNLHRRLHVLLLQPVEQVQHILGCGAVGGAIQDQPPALQLLLRRLQPALCKGEQGQSLDEWRASAAASAAEPTWHPFGK